MAPDLIVNSCGKGGQSEREVEMVEVKRKGANYHIRKTLGQRTPLVTTPNNRRWCSDPEDGKAYSIFYSNSSIYSRVETKLSRIGE